LVEKQQLNSGFWLVFSTVSGIAAGSPGSMPSGHVIDCELRTTSGVLTGLIGAGRSTGGFDEFTGDSWTIPVNGGFAVAPGTSASVALWCRSLFTFCQLPTRSSWW
jgi:hypothetical protein